MNPKLIFALVFSLISTAAAAGGWTTIESNSDESILIDQDSIKISGDELEVRVLRSYANVQLNLLDGEWYAFRSQVATYAIECKEGKLGYIDWVLHHGSQGKGRAVHKGKVVGVLAGDVPATQGETVLVSHVCGSDVALGMLDKPVMAQVGR